MKQTKKATAKAVKYNAADLAEMISEARQYCIEAGVEQVSATDIVGVVLDNHGKEVAKLVKAQLESSVKPIKVAKAPKAAVKPTVAKTPKVEAGNGKTVTAAALQESVKVVEGKLANGSKKPKAVKKEKAAKLGTIFGFTVCSVARALGLAGMKPAAAVEAIHKHAPAASVLGIRTFVQAGRHGLRGAPAPLTQKQLKSLGA